MVETTKKHGFMHMIIDGLERVSETLSARIFPPIAEGTEKVMKKIEESLMRIEKRILKKISALTIMGVGGLFLIFALFFFLIDYLGWNKTTASLLIGTLLFVIGLLLNLWISDRRKDR